LSTCRSDGSECSVKLSRKEFDPVNNGSQRGSWPLARRNRKISCSFEKHICFQNAWLNYAINPTSSQERDAFAPNTSNHRPPTITEIDENRPRLAWLDSSGIFLGKFLFSTLYRLLLPPADGNEPQDCNGDTGARAQAKPSMQTRTGPPMAQLPVRTQAGGLCREQFEMTCKRHTTEQSTNITLDNLAPMGAKHTTANLPHPRATGGHF